MRLNDALTVRQKCIQHTFSQLISEAMTYFSQAAVINIIQTDLLFQSK